ncbi:nitroreductase family protein [Streptomyces cyaneofuscatus]|uniref:nitroreductase family protein n=1 Tax=Streptomyces cyaneofuscatus TaxID=66883 RepID=UPI002952A45E|nr:nitroreductase family protein [Streptomyces cyaneofuscatus]WOP07078.1 nitroreductase family protein [Streptomyces cyaneofuscatus]
MPLINETDLWSLAKRALAPADRPDERTPPGGPSAQDTSRTSPASRISRSVPLHDVLTARRSVRRFRQDPVPDTDLATLLDLATSTDRQMWPHGTAATTPQAWLVSGVTGTSGARLRQYISRRSTAGEFTDRGDSPEPALLATRYAPAPVTILICAQITDDIDTDPDTGSDDTGSDYGRALLRASAFGYNAWLSAVAAGLGGSVYGRSSPEVTRIVRRYTGTPARHLFTLVLGHPAEAPQESGP